MKYVALLTLLLSVFLNGCGQQEPPSSSSTTSTKSPKSSLPGFTNLGNTCFANASLNLFFSSSLFKELMKKPLLQDTAIKESDQRYQARLSLQKALQQLYQARRERKTKLCNEINDVFSAYEQARQLIENSPLIGGVYKIKNDQADASEFLNDILRFLDGQRLILFDYDEFVDKSIKIYKPALASMLGLSLLKKSSSISELLKAYSEPKLMTAPNQAYNEHGVPMDSYRISTLKYPLPSSVIILLKRYEYDPITKGTNRLADEIIPDRMLSMTSRNDANLKEIFSDNYQLRAIVNHAGSSLSGGHYYAYVFDTHYNQWINFNDSSVTAIDEAAVMKDAKNNGYMFLYEKVKL